MELVGKCYAQRIQGAGLAGLVWDLKVTGLPIDQRVNGVVTELYRCGLLRDMLVVGPVVLERRYAGQRAQKTHEVIQAGLSSVDGLVAIYWDSDEYLAANFDPEAALHSLAKERAEPIASAMPIVKGLVCRHAEAMLEKLLENNVVYR